jgi:hypothetical protein
VIGPYINPFRRPEMAKLVAFVVVVGVLLAVLAFVGMSVEDAVKSVLGVLGLGMAFGNRGVQFFPPSRKGEDGFVGVIIALLGLVAVVLLLAAASGNTDVLKDLVCAFVENGQMPAVCGR